MSDWLTQIFSTPATAIIFIVFLLGVIAIFTLIARAYGIGKLCIVLMILCLFHQFAKPYILNILCGDELTNYFLQIFALNQFYFGEPLFGCYFLAQYYSIPYPDAKFWFTLLIEIVQTIAFGIALFGVAKSFKNRDEYRKDRPRGD